VQLKTKKTFFFISGKTRIDCPYIFSSMMKNQESHSSKSRKTIFRKSESDND